MIEGEADPFPAYLFYRLFRFNDSLVFNSQRKPSIGLSQDSSQRLIDLLMHQRYLFTILYRWPYGAKCAMAITGDIDAITILDYLIRPFEQ